MINFGAENPNVVGKFLTQKVSEIEKEIPDVTIYILIFDNDKKALSAGYGCKACIAEALIEDAKRMADEPHNITKQTIN